MRAHYEKVIVLCGFLLYFCNIGFPSTTFSVFQPYLAALPGVGHTGASIVLATRALLTLLCLFVVDRYYAKLSCRAGALIATLCTAIGFFLYSLAKSLPGLCLGAAFAGAGYGLGGMVVIALVMRRWFATGVGTALGIATTGSGIASIIMPPIVARIAENVSLSWAFCVEAIIALAVALIIFALLRDQPSDLGLQPYFKAGASEQTARHAALTTPLPARNMRLLLFAMACLGCVTVNGVSGYFAILLTSEGIPALQAATLVSLLGASLTLAKAGGGVLFDRIGSLRGTIVLGVMTLVGLVFCCLSGIGGLPLAALAAVLFGAGATLGSLGISLWSMEFCTAETLPRTIKNFQVCYAIGAFLFSLVPGPLADLTGGSYVVSYALLLVLALVMLVIVVRQYRMIKH